MAQRRTKKFHRGPATRPKQREIGGSRERWPEASELVSVSRLDLSDATLVEEIRAVVGRSADDIVKQKPDAIDGFLSLPPNVLNAMSPTFKHWGQPGELQLPSGYRGRLSRRSDIATVLGLKSVKGPNRSSSDQKRTGTFVRESLIKALTHADVRAAFGTISVDEFYELNKVANGQQDHSTNINGQKSEAKNDAGEAGKLYRDDFRGTSVEALNRILENASKSDRPLIEEAFSNVLNSWLDRDAALIAKRYRTGLPEDDYRRNIGLIDWQLTIHEQERLAERGQKLPSDGRQHISAALKQACTDQGMDYTKWNDIDIRESSLLRPQFEPSARYVYSGPVETYYPVNTYSQQERFGSRDPIDDFDAFDRYDDFDEPPARSDTGFDYFGDQSGRSILRNW